MEETQAPAPEITQEEAAPWVMDQSDWEGISPEQIEVPGEPAQAVDPEPEQPPPPEEREPTPEEKAASLGWVPQNEWRGDKNRWVPASDFLARSEKVVPMLKKDRENLFREVSELKNSLTEFRKYHEEDRVRTQKRAYEKAWREIKARQKEAVEAGDVDAFEATERQLVELHKNAPQPVPQPRPPQRQGAQPDQLIEWQKTNRWYGTDVIATNYADAISNHVAFKNPHLSRTTIEFFDAVKSEAMKNPEIAKIINPGNPRRSAAQTVHGGGTAPARADGKNFTFSHLPADAKAEAIRLEKAGVMKREQYVKEYAGDGDLVFTIDDF